MDWSLADFYRHPIEGDAGEVAALAAHLTGVAGDIRIQIQRLQGFQSAEFWDSSAGSQEKFQEEIEDLPEDLDLVATRYENVAAALDAYHPVMADTQQDAEYWIQQAEAAQADIEVAEQGVEQMEAFEEQASEAADFANENREEGDPEASPEEWPYQDYRAMLAQAQEGLQRAIDNCHSAVETYGQAHQTCAEAIHEAGNDDLKNDSGFLAGLGRAWDAAMDVLEVVVQVLDVVIAAVAVVGMFLSFIPGMDILFSGILLMLSSLKLAGTLVLAIDGRRSWTAVASAYIDYAAATMNMASVVLGYIPEPASQTASVWLNATSAAATAGGSYFNPDTGPGAPTFDADRGGVGLAGSTIDGIVGSVPGTPNTMFGSGFVGVYDLVNYGNRTDGGWDTLFEPRSQMRPEVDLSHIQFEGLDVAVTPSEMDVPEIDVDVPDFSGPDGTGSRPSGSITLPPGSSGMPDAPVDVEVDVPVGVGS